LQNSVRKEKIDTIFLIKAGNEINNGFMDTFSNKKQENWSFFNLRIRFFKGFLKLAIDICHILCINLVIEMRRFSTISTPFTSAKLLALDFIFPDTCLSCNEPILRSAKSLCKTCYAQLNILDDQYAFQNLTVKDGIDEAYVGWEFSEELRTPIHALKYQDRALLGKELGKMLGDRFENSSNCDYLIPVPLHAVKYRDRGYNQAFWIAKGLGKKWNLPVKKNKIRRIKSTETQTALNQLERRKNMSEAFAIRGNVSGDIIGIVDDVLTTGSTISSMAVDLKRAGAKKISAITVATPLEKHDD
jgi:ComF family protein